MKVKMTTNFKTEKYGFLNNTRVYDVDRDDAKLWIKKGYAVQLDLDLTIEEVKVNNEEESKKLVCSKEELKLKGLREKKQKVNKKSILKRNMIKANARSKQEEEASMIEIVEPLKKEVEDLDEQIKALEEKLNPSNEVEEVKEVEKVEEVKEEEAKKTEEPKKEKESKILKSIKRGKNGKKRS